MLQMKATQLPENVADKIFQTEDGCWLWTGAISSSGYGCVTRRPKTWLAHRYIYSLLVGPCPEGLVSDHLCRERTCVNPDHIEFVTNRENILRGNGAGLLARRTHCNRGHEYTGENTQWRSDKLHARRCVACEKQRTVRRAAERAGGSVR